MHKILFSILTVLFFLFNANAQTKTTGNAIIKVPGLHCDLDKDKIERYLFKSDGITKIKVDVKRKTVTVNWIADRTNLEQIKYDIANVGYDADNVTAEEEARKRLPIGCRVVVQAIPPPPPIVLEPKVLVKPQVDSSKIVKKNIEKSKVKPTLTKKK